MGFFPPLLNICHPERARLTGGKERESKDLAFSSLKFTTVAAFALFLIFSLLAPAQTQAPAQPRQPRGSELYRFRADTEVVLVNVIVRDKSGNPVRGLTQKDFTVLEDGKPQSIRSFDFEDVGVTAIGAPPQAALMVAPKNAPAPAANAAPVEKVDLRDRRLIVLLFDLSSMQPEEIERAVDAGNRYVDQQMSPADLVGVVSLDTSLRVVQDFTSDRDLLKKAITSLGPESGSGFEEGSSGASEGTPDTGGSFTADDSEYNVFNTDRRLEAIESLAQSLSRIEQKKSVIYFSSGMDRTGLENQAQLRNAIDHAIRGNLSLYTMDMRGLQAMVPGGEAQNASLRGTSLYSGAAMRNQYDSNFATQETLSTLADDTGGKAFLDSNDFNQVFRKVQEDTSVYYVLGYTSNNPNRDGRFRRITVRATAPDVKLEFRRGYYAPKDFAHSNRDDREEQLDKELASDLSSTDLDVYLSAAYFRLANDRYYVPVSLVVPGSQIPFARSSDKDKASLDIIGMVKDELQRPVGNARDTVKLSVEGERDVRRKNVQYDTGFVLPSGKYHLKFVLRENETGRIGSFETDIFLPDLKRAPLKLSAVVMGTQIQQGSKRRSENPLVRDGGELIPNVTHVFSSDQHLYFYYEVYDPAKDARPQAKEGEGKQGEAKAPALKNPIRLLTSIAFFQGKVKAYETPLVEARQLSAPDRKAAVFQFDVPLDKLRPGFYICQVNVVDDAAGAFAFPRLALLVRARPAPAVASTSAPASAK